MWMHFFFFFNHSATCESAFISCLVVWSDFTHCCLVSILWKLWVEKTRITFNVHFPRAIKLSPECLSYLAREASPLSPPSPQYPQGLLQHFHRPAGSCKTCYTIIKNAYICFCVSETNRKTNKKNPQTHIKHVYYLLIPSFKQFKSMLRRIEAVLREKEGPTR